jgi:hypothetical protein
MEHLDRMVAWALKEFKVGIVDLLAMEKDGVQNLFLQNVKKLWQLDNNLRYVVDALPSPKLDPRWALASKTVELWGLQGMLPTLNTKRGRGGRGEASG